MRRLGLHNLKIVFTTGHLSVLKMHVNFIHLFLFCPVLLTFFIANLRLAQTIKDGFHITKIFLHSVLLSSMFVERKGVVSPILT